MCLSHFVHEIVYIKPTCSYPDVMMPAYAKSRWSAAFFIAFLAINLYFLMNLVRIEYLHCEFTLVIYLFYIVCPKII